MRFLHNAFSRKAVLLALGLVVLVVLVQLAYPNSRTRPLIKIDGRSFGFATNEQLQTRLQAIDKQNQSLKLTNQSYKTSAAAIGINTLVAKTSEQALQYTWQERLVPFSLFSFGRTNRTPERKTDENILNAYLEKLISENTIPAQNPKISRTDAGEFEVKAGVNGSTYDKQTLKQLLLKLPISDEELGVSADKQLDPAVSDEKAGEIAAKLKANEANLNKLIADWRSKYPNAKTAVYFQEIDGFGRVAKAAEKDRFFAASLYKLFVAHYVFDGMENQTISGADTIAGTTVANCLKAMIVVSDNTCPEAFANRYGWSTIDSFASKNGFGDANIEYGDNAVTAAVMADYLVRLAKGELFDKTNTETLLGYMGKQTYRSAIPAGLPGVTVQDKPGFYGGTWHDAAIVRSSKATYALVVLTEGTGAGAIASLAKQIDALLEPVF